MRIAGWDEFRAFVIARGLKGEFVRDLESGGQVAVPQNGVHRLRSFGEVGEADRQHGSRGRIGDDAQGRLRDNAEQALGSDKGTDEIKTGFVFMAAATGF